MAPERSSLICKCLVSAPCMEGVLPPAVDGEMGRTQGMLSRAAGSARIQASIKGPLVCSPILAGQWRPRAGWTGHLGGGSLAAWAFSLVSPALWCPCRGSHGLRPPLSRGAPQNLEYSWGEICVSLASCATPEGGLALCPICLHFWVRFLLEKGD